MRTLGGRGHRHPGQLPDQLKGALPTIEEIEEVLGKPPEPAPE